MYGCPTYEVWICGRWEGADWDLAEHKSHYEWARKCAEEWQERGFETSIKGPDGIWIRD